MKDAEPGLPTSFESMRTGDPGRRDIVRRDELDERDAEPILEAIQAVEWSALRHAYGFAGDVAPQLVAVTIGDDETRRAAWWNLWGNIHHQGTIYEATIPALPILGRLAGCADYPDRVEAISFVREVARADGVVAWREDTRGEFVFDEVSSASAESRRVTEVDTVARSLLDEWRFAGADVRRALVWLLTVLPYLQDEYAELVDRVLPDRWRRAWETASNPSDDLDDLDEVDRLESWVFQASDGA